MYFSPKHHNHQEISLLQT